MKNPLGLIKAITNEADRTRYLFSDVDDADEETDGNIDGSISWKDNDFIPLNGGLEFIKKYEVSALRWERYTADDGSRLWRLNVFFSEIPHTHVYGDEAKLIMRAFELPEDPPDR